MKKILILLGVIFALILYFYYGGSYMDNKEKNYYNQFNKSNLDNSILSVDEYARGVKLHFENTEVVFYPITNDLNDNKIFLYTAQKGDKVLKKPYKDTLILEKKDGIILKYTFTKPKQ